MLRVLEHPLTRITIGLLLLLSGLDDLVEAGTGREPLGLDLHHGIVASGIKQVLAPLLEFAEGGSHVIKATSAAVDE